MHTNCHRPSLLYLLDTICTLFTQYLLICTLYLLSIARKKNLSMSFHLVKPLATCFTLHTKTCKNFSPCFECQFHITLRDAVTNAQGVGYSLK